MLLLRRDKKLSLDSPLKALVGSFASLLLARSMCSSAADGNSSGAMDSDAVWRGFVLDLLALDVLTTVSYHFVAFEIDPKILSGALLQAALL